VGGGQLMGIFSKPKREPLPADDTIKQVISKFQGWTDSYTAIEINGRKVSSAEVKDFVAWIIKQSISLNDELLLQWSSKVCVAMLSATTEVAPVDSMAQVMFDSTVGSMTLRKRYAKNPQLLDAIETLGVASYKMSEKHPKFREVLQYMVDNSEKLAGK
jgi:hypothetical protein